MSLPPDPPKPFSPGPPDVPGAENPGTPPVLGNPPPFPNPPPGVTPVWRCPMRVGFLFPHQCSKVTSVGCRDCGNGQVTDPYLRRDRYGYDDYDSYDSYYYGSSFGLFGHRHRYGDFTEGDGENLVKPRKEFEEDMSGS